MWRLWHLLFGWDYVLLEYGHSLFTKKVRYMRGRPYVRCFSDWFWLKPDGSTSRSADTFAACNKYIPLTFDLPSNNSPNVVSLHNGGDAA